MATFTDVDTNQINNTAQGIRQHIESMKGIRNALESSVISRLIPCWQGEAKDLFTHQFTSYCASLKTLIDSYEELNRDLISAETAYRGANDQVTGEIRKLG